MDQAFSSPSAEFGITRRPFLEALTVISRLRDEEFLGDVWRRLAQESGGDDARASVAGFWRDCVMTKYQFLDGASAARDADRSLADLVSDFPSKIYGTVYYGASGRQEVTCQEAAAKVNAILQKVTPELVNSVGYFGASRMEGTPGASAVPSSELLDSSMELLGASAATGTAMVKASLLLPLFRKSGRDYYHSRQDYAAGLMVGQAVMQRNIQWAAEQSVFVTTVRPFVTFFEGFVYAISPFMAILICMGGFGIGIALRYFQTLIWIQLWMPILCIINAYVYSGLKAEVARSLTAGRSWDSPSALDALHAATQNWAATAGMLAAATPLIALFVVTASTYTFTTVAGRMGGRDHVDEKIMAPDALSQPPILANEQNAAVLTATGSVLKSRAAQLPSISFGSSDARALSSAWQTGLSRTLAASRSLNETWLHSIGSSESYDSRIAIQDAVTASGSSMLSDVWKKSVQEASRAGTDASAVFAGAMSQIASTSASVSQGDRQGLSGTLGVSGALAAGGSAGARAGSNVSASRSAGAFAESRDGSSASSSDESRSSYSSSSTSARDLGRSIAAEYSGSESRSLTLALSRGISASAGRSGSMRDESSTLGSREKRFSSALTELSQFSSVSTEMNSAAWRQEADLRSFAFDARRRFGSRLDDMASTLTSDPKAAALLSRYAADYRDRFGISDSVTAGDMAILRACHEGSPEQKAGVLALWSQLNGGAAPEPAGAGMDQAAVSEEIRRGETEVYGGTSAARAGYSAARGAFDDMDARASSQLSAAGSIPNDQRRGIEGAGAGIARAAYSEAEEAINGAIGARVSVVQDSAGRQVVYSSGRVLDPGSLAREGGVMGAAAASALAGGGTDLLASDQSGLAAKGRLLESLPAGIGRMVSSPMPLPMDEAGIRASGPLREYASEHGMNLENPEDMRRMSSRAKLFSLMQSDFHAGSVINFALDANAAGRVEQLDAGGRAAGDIASKAGLQGKP